jgi:S1-C subfamily serine protease
MINAPPSSRRFQRSLVRVEVRSEFGSAFLVNTSAGSGIFLTALHVVSSAWNGSRTVLLRRNRETEFFADVVAVNETRDLALLMASKIPSDLGLRPAPLATVLKVGRLTVLNMLDPKEGIVAPLPVTVSFVGETAVAYEVDGAERIIDKVWSQQGLTIPGGTSGGPVVSEEDDAVVAVACAGADALKQTFFVPLVSAQARASQTAHQQLSEAIRIATETSTRLGRSPNRRGIKLRCWLQCRTSVQSLTVSGVFNRDNTIPRASLGASIKKFVESGEHVAILAGTSGAGKSAGLARIARSQSLSRPCLLLRAAQVKLTEHPLEDALASALGIPSADSIANISIYDSAPLLIIDGINELGLKREEWSSFVQIHLARVADLLVRKGWKLLISTRSDRLDDLQDASKFPSLYDPAPEDERKKLPFIRIGGFERDEFDRLIKLNGLPGGLPFADLRHPIVFRLMVESYKQKSTSPIRVRSFFEDYLSTLVLRIHARCQTRSRDRIRKLLESWAALPETTLLGYIDSANLGAAENEAIAEAAVAEGLFERVPNGYRYVYDEIFDFVRAKPLVDYLAQCSERKSILGVIDALLESGCQPGAVARAFEMLSDNQPDVLATLADRLAN